MAHPIVVTASGKVRGSVVDDVCRFYGVPYAAPPVGALRFQKPAPAPSWSGERDATRKGANAPQAARQFPGLDIAPIEIQITGIHTAADVRGFCFRSR